jgi:hypothetical protein
MSRRRVVASASLAIAQLWGAQAFASQDTDATKFMATYNYCDAKILAGAWATSEYEAKARGGAKIIANATPILEQALTEGRKKGKKCDWVDTGFTYEDAEALSKLWGTTVEEAKTALASKLTEGYRDLAKQVVAEAHAKKAPAGDGSVKPVKPVKPVLKPINKPGPVAPKAPK